MLEIKLNANANVRLKESAVNLSPSNCFRVLTGLTRCHMAVAAMVVASALAPPAFANTITFETASLGVFTGPVTEDGFTYTKLSGGLLWLSLATRGTIWRASQPSEAAS
jgi:hypothetical protein